MPKKLLWTRAWLLAYPNIAGITPLKEQASRFIKAFLNVDVNPEGCVPTVGSMMGTFASFITCTHLSPEKDTILFIDPGFSVQPLQAKVLGYKRESFDVYDCRGTRLRDKLEGILSQGHIAAIIYSNPNNPSWVCLTEEELSYIGALATKYDTIVIEDLAYLGMDFRKDLGTSVPASLCGDCRTLYGKLYPHAFRIEDIQLCRRTYRHRGHFQHALQPRLSGLKHRVRH